MQLPVTNPILHNMGGYAEKPECLSYHVFAQQSPAKAAQLYHCAAAFYFIALSIATARNRLEAKPRTNWLIRGSVHDKLLCSRLD